MGTRIDDEMLDAFAIVGEPHEIAASSSSATADSIDRLLATFAFSDEAQRSKALAELRLARSDNAAPASGGQDQLRSPSQRPPATRAQALQLFEAGDDRPSAKT